jgi:hypothetical protein
MSLMKKLAVLGAAAEAARRYAQKNPDKARELADKAARFADHQTKGRYSGQINQAQRKLADLGGFADQADLAAPAAPAAPAGSTTPPAPVTPPAPATGPAPLAQAEVAPPTRPTPYKRG